MSCWQSNPGGKAGKPESRKSQEGPKRHGRGGRPG